MALVTTVAI